MTRSRLRLFAKATGQTDPLYLDVDVARAAGHDDLPVPPTFYFGVEMELPDPFAHLSAMGIDLRTVLHAEQEFVYSRIAHAGDELTSKSCVVDMYEKRGGALKFLVSETKITDQHDCDVVAMRNTLVVRALGDAAA